MRGDSESTFEEDVQVQQYTLLEGEAYVKRYIYEDVACAVVCAK